MSFDREKKCLRQLRVIKTIDLKTSKSKNRGLPVDMKMKVGVSACEPSVCTVLFIDDFCIHYKICFFFYFQIFHKIDYSTLQILCF